MRQAETFAPYTERLIRDAGIASGQRVLDVGSGVGDVALLTASVVGHTGSVLGIDRDPMALRKARSRSAGARNIEFLETDLSTLRIDGQFDAIVGRFILMFLPDPVATLRALSASLRPGGIIVFQESSWASFYPLAESLPLRTACADLICATLTRAGARPDMPSTLYRGLLDCGYHKPHLRVEVPVAEDEGGVRWLPDPMQSLRRRFEEFNMDTRAVGDLGTLAARLELEQQRARSFPPLVGLVGAWARKPI